MRILPVLLSMAAILTSTALGGQDTDQPDVHFVSRQGSALVLDGSGFRFVGSNLYNAAGDPGVYECGPWMAQPDVELEDWFAHAREDYSATVVRFWAFQSYTMSGTNWQPLDRVMRLARRRGLHVIPVLENQWPECTQSGYKDARWYRDGYKASYGTYSLSYIEFVRRVVERYRDDDTVLAWSLMNEAESQTVSGVADHEALLAFTADMSAYIKSLDPRHLVTLGVIGGGQPGLEGDAFGRLHALDTIDLAEYHDYLHDNQPLPGASIPGMASDFGSGRFDFAPILARSVSGLGRALNEAAALQKPVVVAEAGMSTCYAARSGPIQTPQSRAAKFEAKLSAFFAVGGAGYLVWTWHPADDCGYNFSIGDPLNGVLARHAAALTPSFSQTSDNP